MSDKIVLMCGKQQFSWTKEWETGHASLKGDEMFVL